MPPGSHVVHVVAGNFSRTFTVQVTANSVVTLPEQDCEIDTSMRIAVVEGSFDPILTVLNDVGVDPALIDVYDPQWFNEDLLSNFAVLSQYDAVFISCGVQESFYGDGIIANNIRSFVQQGGALYASDWTYDLVEMAFPDRINFAGDDGWQNDAQIGASYEGAGNIVDATLAAAVGSNTIALSYPLTDWAMMQGVAANVHVYIVGDAYEFDENTYSEILRYDVPHTVSFAYGAGYVVYSSFHQEPGISYQQEQVLYQLMFAL